MAEKKRILIIDDDPDTLHGLEEHLQQEGYEVLTSTDGLDGLEKARNQRPDLILMELMLSKLQGFKVCRFLKFDETFKHIPIIILSDRTDPEDQDLAMEVGADLYVQKPFDPTHLSDNIRSQLGMINLI